jgi:hypothetical protein
MEKQNGRRTTTMKGVRFLGVRTWGLNSHCSQAGERNKRSSEIGYVVAWADAGDNNAWFVIRSGLEIWFKAWVWQRSHHR